MDHDALVKIAERWLLSAKGCGFVLIELCAAANGETPDAIGWRSGYSILVECKTSRADFFADKKKLFRRNPSNGMGSYRFFMCPEGMIMPADLPPSWGLVWINDRGKAIQKVGPKGNIWYGKNAEPFLFEKSMLSEQEILVSALRRLQLRGVIPLIYNSPQTEPA